MDVQTHLVCSIKRVARLGEGSKRQLKNLPVQRNLKLPTTRIRCGGSLCCLLFGYRRFDVFEVAVNSLNGGLGFSTRFVWAVLLGLTSYSLGHHIRFDSYLTEVQGSATGFARTADHRLAWPPDTRNTRGSRLSSCPAVQGGPRKASRDNRR
jgi:hypothetical protein